MQFLILGNFQYAEMQSVVKDQKLAVLNNEMSSMSSELKLLEQVRCPSVWYIVSQFLLQRNSQCVFVLPIQLFDDNTTKLNEVQSFQGQAEECSKIYKEDSPLAGILSTVYVVKHNACHMLFTSDFLRHFNSYIRSEHVQYISN